MTGYGAGEIKNEDQGCLVEIKTLNNRFCDIYIKNNFTSLEIEQKIEKTIKAEIFRGKINVFIKINSHQVAEQKVELNEKLATSYYVALENMKNKFNLKEEITLNSMLKMKDVFQVKRTEKIAELWILIEETLQKALNSLQAMRKKEGKSLVKDIWKRIRTIEKKIAKIEKNSENSIIKYKDNFLAKLTELTDNININEGRLELEAAIFAEKNDINEEIIRAKSHLDQFTSLLNSDKNEPVGRKMDFIIQEINREINTIGSKVNDSKISSLVIVVKSELEKIREQVRNIE